MNKSYIRSSNRVVGFPSPAKFRSGHLPSGVIPVHRVVEEDLDDTESGSDMDETTDSEEKVYRGRYSVDSSSPRGVKIGRDPVSKQPNYASDGMYSDFSSSRETVREKEGNVVERSGPGDRNAGVREDYTDEESSNSSMSSDVQSSRVRRAPEAYNSDGKLLLWCQKKRNGVGELFGGGCKISVF